MTPACRDESPTFERTAARIEDFSQSALAQCVKSPALAGWNPKEEASTEMTVYGKLFAVSEDGGVRCHHHVVILRDDR